jgi:hypothetical protein
LSELLLKDFGRGLNLKELPEQIGDNELQDAQNFLLTQSGQLEPRLGFATVNASGTPANKTLKGGYIYCKPDGSEVKVIRGGDQLYYLSGADTWTELSLAGSDTFVTGAKSTFSFATTAGGTTKTLTSTAPITTGTWILTNATASTQAAHESGGSIVADGSSGVTGTINLGTGAVSLSGLTTSTNYSGVYSGNISKTLTHAHAPINSDTWILTNASDGTQAAHEHSGAIVADGSTGITGTINSSTGAVSLAGLIAEKSYTIAFTPATALITGGDRTCFCNHNGNLYIADGYNFLKLNGTTLTDVNVGGNHYTLPYYLCSHDARLYAGNLRLKIDGSNYTDYKRSITWSGVRDDTRWTPPNDTNICRIDFDYDVTGFVSFGHLVIFTSQATYYAVVDSSLLGNYYFPSVQMQSRIGAVPFSMCSCDQDVWFANETGVWAISKTDKFGDLEKNRLSYKVDPVFDTDLYASGSLCAVYLPWRDEYWLSYQTAAATWKVLVGKRSLFDEWGRPPWMRLNLSSRDWCVAPKTQDMFFTSAAGTYRLWQYGGRSDNGAQIKFKVQTKTFGGETRERKRVEWVTVGRRRWAH